VPGTSHDRKSGPVPPLNHPPPVLRTTCAARSTVGGVACAAPTLPETGERDDHEQQRCPSRKLHCLSLSPPAGRKYERTSRHDDESDAVPAGVDLSLPGIEPLANVTRCGNLYKRPHSRTSSRVRRPDGSAGIHAAM
jgi:hypothetical protein